ncbi:MAG: phage major capsid protein [Terriglobales bacterium]
MQLFELKRNRKEALDAAEAIVARVETEKRQSMTPLENAEFEQHMAKVKRLNAQIEPIEAKNTLGIRANERGFFDHANTQPEEKNGGRSFGAPARKTSLLEAMAHASTEEAEKVRTFARYVGGDMTALADLTPGGDGGVFIPTLVAGVVERNYAAFTPVVDNCRVWPTQFGEPMKFPVVTDDEDAVILAPAALTGADATISGDTPPTEIDGPLMNAYKFSSKPVFIPRETITDSTLNVLEEILSALLARIYRTQNKKYTVGTGSGEPEGFMHNATAYPAGAVALDLDIALDLAYSVPALYRPTGIYMASDTTVKYLRKLKTGLTGDKRALWKDAFEEGNATLGTPAKLHGYPLIVNNDMDSVAADGTFAGVSPLAFGDFKRFVVRNAELGTPYIYRYSVPAKDGGAVITFQRSDSKLIVPVAISKLTVS